MLGGLVEGVWPPQVEPGPWLSRPMRAAIGLPSPEEAVGQAAHDFAQAACAAPTVVLSCPRRRDGAPAVPARWLTRIEMFLKGQRAGDGGMALPEHPAADWARQLDQPDGAARPVRPPEPRPPAALRPRRLSVTEIETWLRDPYAIHARHVLRLRPLDPLDQETDAADYGVLVHAGLHRFLREHGTAWPPDAAARLREALAGALAPHRPARGAARLVDPAPGPHRRLGRRGRGRPPRGGAAHRDRVGGARVLDAAPPRRGVRADRAGGSDRAARRHRRRPGPGHPGLQDRLAAHPGRGGCRPGAATAAGGRDGRGRRVRRRAGRAGGGAGLLAPVRRVRSRHRACRCSRATRRRSRLRWPRPPLRWPG